MQLADLKKGQCLVGDCGSPMDQVPEWMDFERFRRGREFFLRNCAAIVFSMHCSLVSGLSIVNLLEPLVFTEQSDTPEKAFRRYMQTFLHVVLWQTDDVWEAPDGKAHRSIRVVRNMHNSVAARMNKGKREGVDVLHFSQYDMALVQSGFFGAVILHPEEFGLAGSEQELSDYVFVWRGIGYLLGIDDRYNLCSGDLKQTYNIVKEIETELLMPALDNPPKDFDRMSIAYMQGTNIPTHVEFMTREALFALMSPSWGRPTPTLGFLDSLRWLYLKVIMFMFKYVRPFVWLSNYSMMKGFRRELPNLKL